MPAHQELMRDSMLAARQAAANGRRVPQLSVTDVQRQHAGSQTQSNVAGALARLGFKGSEEAIPGSTGRSAVSVARTLFADRLTQIGLPVQSAASIADALAPLVGSVVDGGAVGDSDSEVAGQDSLIFILLGGCQPMGPFSTPDPASDCEARLTRRGNSCGGTLTVAGVEYEVSGCPCDCNYKGEIVLDATRTDECEKAEEKPPDTGGDDIPETEPEEWW